ncbi:response regulator transcription factor [Sphaerimonospora sp. CA-214678]|uniref:response regulator transcription factor n=1 Tax=Sphaerimonospora sp. CA-214678 TaxID=3240029 RepID=UPI003D8DAFD1
MIKVLLAEDQGMMRGALALLLGLEDDIEVVAQVSSGEEVAAAALATRPDVALLDIEMPGRDVLSAAADGTTIADIAARLHLSESTVRNYLSSAIGKTGTRNRIEAARHQGRL